MRPCLVSSRSCLLALLLLGAVAGCQRGVEQTGCKANLDCGDFRFCDVANGVCLCLDDNACDGAEFCNAAGRCQEKLDCLSNADCQDVQSPNGMCDSRNGTCVTLSASFSCVLDSQCAYGSHCANNVCVPGCNDNGDCMLGQPCIDGVCSSDDAACTDNSFCDFGDACDTTTNRCVAHSDKADLCGECNGLNIGGAGCRCLIDTSIAPNACQSDGDCVDNGSCQAVRTQPSLTCTTDPECGPGWVCEPGPFGGTGICTGKPCAVVGDCPANFDCAAGLLGGPKTCSKRVCSSPDDCENGFACVDDAADFSARKFCSEAQCQGAFCGSATACDPAEPGAEACPAGYECNVLINVGGLPQCTVGSGTAECSNGGVCVGGGENGALGFCACTSDNDCGFAGGGRCVNGGCIIGSTCGPQDGLLCSDLL